MGNRDRRLLSVKGQAVGVALLRRHPSFLDQITVAIIGDAREVPACLRLLQRRTILAQSSFGLGDLVIELRGGNLRQKIASLHMIAYIDLAHLDVTVCARKYIC